MHRLLSGLSALLLMLGLGMIIPVAAEAAPYCGIAWGSLEKTATASSSAHVEDLRTGQHTCYDRLVIDLDHDVVGYTAGYVSAVHRPGSGAVVALDGGADLQIVVQAPAYDDAGRATYAPTDRDHAVAVDGYRTFRQVALAGSFEGETVIGLGVRARLPMRVFVLDGPGNGSRIVVDVAHRW
ncbi:AMIN-like domain-containing (lipo)protein [Brachybacterium sp. DNPG3]